jgi:hypothetical protein
MDLWDIEWFSGDGRLLESQYGLDRESADRQARSWLQDTPGSRVFLYRRRGERSVLVRILTGDEQDE